MNGLESLYQELILDHSKRPIGKAPLGPLPEDGTVFDHHEFNPSCGDELTLRVQVDPDSSVITSLAWDGQGCSISMASASVLAGLVRDGQWTVATAHDRIDAFRSMLRSQGNESVDEELLGDAIAFQGVGKFVMRVKCAMLGWVALESDLAQFEAQHSSS